MFLNDAISMSVKVDGIWNTIAGSGSGVPPSRSGPPRRCGPQSGVSLDLLKDTHEHAIWRQQSWNIWLVLSHVHFNIQCHGFESWQDHAVKDKMYTHKKMLKDAHLTPCFFQWRPTWYVSVLWMVSLVGHSCGLWSAILVRVHLV